METYTPGVSARAEEVALFRHAVIGSLLGRDFDHGELSEALRALAQQRWRPPGSAISRRFGASTIERWYYAYRAAGLAGLMPQRRQDAGRARTLDEAMREMLLDIRREYPRASAPLILRTLISHGTLSPGEVSVATLNRLYADHGLRRQGRNRSPGAPRERKRWQTAQPGMLWHGDVCHGPTLDGRIPVRIHALLDDHSRYVVALDVYSREREVEMLEIFGKALVREGKPRALYLDNGSTYIGERLQAVCGRLAVGLRHAQPRDPEARGKMERFWRTMREQCLDFIPPSASLHDIRVRLHAWLDQHYHAAPHAGLLGRTPAAVWATSESAMRPLEVGELESAFVEREDRRVRKDGTLTIEGKTWELDAGFLAGKVVTVRIPLPPASGTTLPCVEHGERTISLHLVDPTGNAKKGRKPVSAPKPVVETGFDPATTQLQLATGQLNPNKKESA